MKSFTNLTPTNKAVCIAGIIIVTILSVPVLASWAGQSAGIGPLTESVHAARPVQQNVGPDGHDVVKADDELEAGADDEKGDASDDTAYAVVCCAMGDYSTCHYYIGTAQCPAGTAQVQCPCRQTHE